MDSFATCKVVNRRKIQYDAMFSGRTIVFKPGEAKYLPANVADGIVRDSVLKIDLASGLPSQYALAIEEDGEKVQPLTGALAKQNDVEVLDRTNDHLLTETEPKVLSADGEESLGIGKADKTVTPPPADEMRALSFINPEAKVMQRGGMGPSRVAVKNS